MTDEAPTQAPAPAPALPWTRTLYWSVRRELWEHSAIYLAPLAVAGIALFGFLFSLFRLPRALRLVEAGAQAGEALMTPYSFVALAVMVTGFIVAVFYALAALHGERQDRSLLFWKSLPVSDAITVLSKAAVAVLVAPAVVLAAILGAQAIMLTLASLVVLANGMAPAMLWDHVGLGLMWVVLPYGLVVIALWSAPLYAWLLLVSGWARRMTFIWAVAPPLALAALERMAFGTTHIIHLLGSRLFDGFGLAFSVKGQGTAAVGRLADLDPVRAFGSLGLWGGLAAAALLLAATIRLRRSRDPI